MLVAPTQDFTVTFSHSETSAKLYFKGHYQFIMELNDFRFNSQEIEQSDDERLAFMTDPVIVEDGSFPQYQNEEGAIALKKEIQDLTYMNGKLKTDRQKLLLRVREVEVDFKEKQKLILREIRQAKSFFQRKIKVRQNIYEEQLEKLVHQVNEEQSQAKRMQDTLRDQIDKYKTRSAKDQLQIQSHKEEASRLKHELEESVRRAQQVAQDHALQERRVSQQLRRYEQQITKCQHELTKLIETFAKEKETLNSEHNLELDAVRSAMRIQGEAAERNRLHLEDQIEKMGRTCIEKQQRIRDLQQHIQSINNALSSKHLELKQNEFMFDETTDRIRRILAEKEDVDNNLRTLQDEIEKQRRLYDDLQYNFNRIEMDLETKKEELVRCEEAMRVKDVHYEEDLEELRNEIESLKREVALYRDRESALSDDKDNLELEVKKLKELRNLDTEKSSRNEIEYNNLKRLLEERDSLLTNKERQLYECEETLNKLRGELHMAQISNEDLLFEVEKLRANIANQEAANSMRLQELEEEIKYYEELRRKQNQNEEKMHELIERAREKEQYVSRLEKSNSELNKKLMKQYRLGAADELAGTSDILLDAESVKSESINSPERSLNEVNAESDRLKMQNAMLENQLVKLKRATAEKDSTIKELEYRLQSQMMGGSGTGKGQVQNLKELLSQKDKKYERKDRECQQFKIQIAEMQTKIRELTDALQEKDQRIENLISRMAESMTNSIDAYDNNDAIIIQLQNQLAVSSRKIQDMQSEIESLQEEAKKRESAKSKIDNFSFMPEARKNVQKSNSKRDFHETVTAMPVIQGQLENVYKVKELEEMLQNRNNEILRLKAKVDELNEQVQSGIEAQQEIQQNRHHTADITGALKLKEAQLIERVKQLEQIQALRNTQIAELRKSLGKAAEEKSALDAEHRGCKQKEMEQKLREKEAKVEQEALNRQVALRKENETWLANELKSKSGKFEKLEQEIKVHTDRENSLQRDIDRLKLTLQTRERELNEAIRSRDELTHRMKREWDEEGRQKRQETEEIKLRELGKEVQTLKQLEYKLKKQVEKLEEEREQKYIKISEHRIQKQQLERTVREKQAEAESLQKVVQQLQQLRQKLEANQKNHDSELEDMKRKHYKQTEEQKSISEQKDTEIRSLKKKIVGLERMQEDDEAKINNLQDRLKTFTAETEKVIQELSRKNMLQIKESHSLREQNEIASDQIRVLKKRHQDAQKIIQDLEDRISSIQRYADESKRAVEKAQKELSDCNDQLVREKNESRRMSDEIRRFSVARQDAQKQIREARLEIQKLEKAVALAENESKRILREMQRMKNQASQNDQDRQNYSKSAKMQLEKLEEARRRLEKQLDQKDYELKNANARIQKSEEDRKAAAEMLSHTYTDKINIYAAQVETIKKTIKEYEDEIIYLKNQIRDLVEEADRSRFRILTLQNELKIQHEAYESKSEELQAKKQELDRLRHERFEIEISHGKLSSDVVLFSDENKKLVERANRLSQQNSHLIDSNEKLENDIRHIKSMYAQLEYQRNFMKDCEIKWKEAEATLKEVLRQKQELVVQLKQRDGCLYSEEDFEKYKQTMLAKVQQEKELELEEALNMYRQEMMNDGRKVELQMIDLLNETSKLRAQLEKLKESNNALLIENMSLHESERGLKEQARKLGELEQHLEYKVRELTELQKIRDKIDLDLKNSLNSQIQLQRQVQMLQKQKAEVQRELDQQRAKTSVVAETHIIEQKATEVLKKMNEELRNKVMQLEFEYARLKEQIMEMETLSDKRVVETEQREKDKLKQVEQSLMEKLYRAETELSKQRDAMEQLRFVVEEKNHEIDFAREEIDYYETEMNGIRQDIKKTKAKANEDKEVYSLEIYRLGNKLKDTEEKWMLKTRSLEEELIRVTSQLQVASSRVERQMTYSKVKVNAIDSEDRQVRKLEEKLKLKEVTIEELKQEVLQLQQKVYRLDMEVSPRGIRIDEESLKELARVREELKSLQDEHSDCKQNYTQLEEELAAVTQTSVNLKKQINRLKRSQEDLNEQLDQSQMKITSLQAEVSYLKGIQTSHKQLKSHFDRITQEMRQKRDDEIQQNSNNIWLKEKAQLEQRIAELAQSLDNAQVQLAKLQIIHSASTAPTSAVLKQAEHKTRQGTLMLLEECRKKEAVLREQLENSNTMCQSLLKQTQTLETEKLELQGQVRKLKSKMEDLNEENVRLSEQIFKLNSSTLREQLQKEEKNEMVLEKWDEMLHVCEEHMGVSSLEEGFAKLIECFLTRKESARIQSTIVAERDRLIDELQERFRIREQEFKFERERDQLDIQELTRQNEKLQARIDEMEFEIQEKQQLELEFERMEYEYRECRGMLDQLKAQLKLYGEQEKSGEEAGREDLEAILQRVHLR